MTLETTFYILAIITMSISLLLMIAIAVILYRLKQTIESYRSGLPGKIMGLIKKRNAKVASALGVTVAGFVLDKIRGRFTDDSDSKKS